MGIVRTAHPELLPYAGTITATLKTRVRPRDCVWSAADASLLHPWGRRSLEGGGRHKAFQGLHYLDARVYRNKKISLLKHQRVFAHKVDGRLRSSNPYIGKSKSSNPRGFIRLDFKQMCMPVWRASLAIPFRQAPPSSLLDMPTSACGQG